MPFATSADLVSVVDSAAAPRSKQRQEIKPLSAGDLLPQSLRPWPLPPPNYTATRTSGHLSLFLASARSTEKTTKMLCARIDNLKKNLPLVSSGAVLRPVRPAFLIGLSSLSPLLGLCVQ